MKDANRPDAAPRRHQLADTEQDAGDTVNPDEAAAGRGGNNAGGLTVDERRGAALIEPDGRPPGQRRLGWTHARPEVRSPGGQLTPRHGLVETEGADAAAHELLDRAPAAERGADVGRQNANVRPLAADDAHGRPRARDRFHLDRPDDHLARRALDLDALASQLVEPAPLVVNRRIHGRHLLDAPDECAAHFFEVRYRELRDGLLGQDAATHV